MNFADAVGVIELGNVKIKCIIFIDNTDDKIEILSS